MQTKKLTILEDDDAMPVPQVKVGPDGSIIVDDSSTLIETTASKKAKEDLLKTQLVRLDQRKFFLTCLG